MSIVVDQRKRNINQTKPNVALQSNQQSQQQQNSKKGNKQQNQQHNQSSAVKSATSTGTSTPAPPPVLQPEEPHVPLKGFNGEEIDELLKAGYDDQALMYTLEQSAQQKIEPWGQKPGSMSNGKDFWLELRKQVATLSKGESTNKGG